MRHKLDDMDPATFEHMVNALALRVLGNGHTGFGPGSDGGRDGLYVGTAPYPSDIDCWSGVWYIQSKYHAPHLTTDSQAWLATQVEKELAAFRDSAKRHWPDIWILATNVDPSPTPQGGSFDQVKALVRAARPQLADHFAIWGGTKIIDYLGENEAVARRYGHFLTPGHILSTLQTQLEASQASPAELLRCLLTKELDRQRSSKIEQAGSKDDNRPGVHRLFVDLPISVASHKHEGFGVRSLVKAAAQTHSPELASQEKLGKTWQAWRSHPERSPVWFIRGGPGQGKSTIGQLFAQIQRAALILADPKALEAHHTQLDLANEIRETAVSLGFWPTAPRIPIQVELRDYAFWYGQRSRDSPRGLLTYLSSRLSSQIEVPMMAKTLKAAMTTAKWLLVLDGLDEVPSDTRDDLANETIEFVKSLQATSDVFTICSSRPQGYSGQFDALEPTCVDLVSLSSEVAQECALNLIRFNRSKEEVEAATQILTEAMKSEAVQEIMRTPLQAHIIAVIVRAGQRPPERKWALYRQFYEVVRTREANRDLPDRNVAELLRRELALLRAVHNELGFKLHALAETSAGAKTHFSRAEFKILVERIVRQMKEGDVAEIVETVMTASIDRLVLITTPDDGQHVRFDVRTLQEFFAGEYVYDGVSPDRLRDRLRLIAGDAHWREVNHFVVSALVETNRRTELAVAVGVLEWVDNGKDALEERPLARRLAKGAAVAGRLFADGVLEQDKGVRNAFRSALDPLGAAKSFNLLAGMVARSAAERRHVSMQSEQWIARRSLERLAECAVSQVMGSVFFLWWNIRDDDQAGQNAFLNFWRNLGHSEHTDFFRTFISSYHSSTTAWHDWHADVFVEAMFAKVGDTSFSVASDWSRERPETFHAALNKLFGVDADRLMRHAYAIMTSSSAAVQSDHGWAIVERTKTPEISLEAREFINTCDIPRLPRPGLRAIAHAMRFLVTLSRADYLAYLASLGESWCYSYTLPGVPATDILRPPALMRQVERLDDAAFGAALAAGRIGSASFKPSITAIRYKPAPSTPTTESVVDYIQAAPYAFAYQWASSIQMRQTGKDSQLTSPELARAIADSVLSDASLIHALPLIVWGWLLPNSSDPEALRSLFRQVARDQAWEPLRMAFVAEDFPFFAFSLDLPDDAPLLPPLVVELIARSNAYGAPVPESHREEDSTSRRENCGAEVRQYVQDRCGLDAIARNAEFSAAERVAATLLAAVHPQGGASIIERDIDDLVRLAPSIEWFDLAFSGAARLCRLESYPRGRAMVSSVLQSPKPWGSAHWEHILHTWRETSTSPVSAVIDF